MAFKRVTEEERRFVYRWRQEGLGPREMGRRLGRSAGSLSREIRRNSGRRGYRPKQAHAKAQQRARRAGPRCFTPEVWADAEKRLQEGWTPEIISGRARREGPSLGVQGDDLPAHLRRCQGGGQAMGGPAAVWAKEEEALSPQRGSRTGPDSKPAEDRHPADRGGDPQDRWTLGRISDQRGARNGESRYAGGAEHALRRTAERPRRSPRRSAGCLRRCRRPADKA